MTLPQPLTALDYEQIRQLVTRYGAALTAGNADLFAACFTHEAVFTESGLPGLDGELRFTGRAEIRRFALEHHEKTGGTVRYLSSLPMITGIDEQASGEMFLVLVRAGTAPSAGVVLTGTYRDQYVKFRGSWLFASRHFAADEVVPARDPLISAFDRFVVNASS